ncbi:MAG: hypothetical protein RLZZ116_2381 [Planctomycetota bacterium]|jgi:Lecithin:cholesterol acyltransferase
MSGTTTRLGRFARRLSNGLVAAVALQLAACAGQGTIPLESIYGPRARATATTRTPVVVIPGILGSKLIDRQSGRTVWGAFQFGAVDADIPADARLFALPMREGAPLAQLTDDVDAPDALDTVKLDIGLLRGLELGAYVDLLQALAAGRYRDSALAPPDENAVKYGGLHYTCWQHPYDWRREISENAAALDARIKALQQTVRAQRGLAADAEVRVDLLCHSMGGLLGQWYLRYGAMRLPDEGPAPEPTWEGARNIRNFIMVGTPSGGSTNVLNPLRNGLDLNPLFPYYRPSLVGTFPAMYQLIPPDDLARVVDAAGAPVAIHDPATWERLQWGLADPAQDQFIAWLLPDVPQAADRRRIALDHLRKCLGAAERFHEALRRPSRPPAHLRRVLFAGDAIMTPSIREIRADGTLHIRARAPGDGEVTRASALGDAAVAKDPAAPAEYWLDFDTVVFLPYEHLEMVGQPLFVDNLLYELLERD